MNMPIIQYFNNKIQNCDSVPVDKPCCLMFHGYKTIKANIVKHEIEKYHIFNNNEVNLYGSYYKINGLTSADAILATNTLIPPVFHHYVNRIFNIAFLPRICDSNNKKLPIDIAIQNISKMTIFTHCYGVFVADYLIKILDKTLKKLEYAPEEIARIHKQLVIVTQSSPYLLYNKPVTVFNFASLVDKAISYQGILPNIDKLTFVDDYNLILTPNFYNEHYFDAIKNHQPKEIEHWLWTITEPKILSENGVKTVDLLKTVLHNSIQRTEINKSTDLFDTKSINTISANIPNVNYKILWNIIKYSVTRKR